MKILYLLFSIFLLLFQATSGSADPLFPDTMECRRQGNFCLRGACPTPLVAKGSCHLGAMNCCSKILAE